MPKHGTTTPAFSWKWRTAFVIRGGSHGRTVAPQRPERYQCDSCRALLVSARRIMFRDNDVPATSCIVSIIHETSLCIWSKSTDRRRAEGCLAMLLLVSTTEVGCGCGLEGDGVSAIDVRAS